MTNYTPAQLEAWAGLGPWRTCNVSPDLGHIYGSIGRLATSIGGESNRTQTNAALIAAAPDLARLVLEKEKEIARLKAAALDLVSLCSADVKMNGTTYQPMPYRPAFTKAVERMIELINTDRQAMKETSDE